MIFLIILIFLNNPIVFSQNLYYCSENSANSPITVNSGQWIRYETKDYPKTLAHDGNSGFTCNQTFLNGGLQNFHRLWITLVNGKLDEMLIFDDRAPTREWSGVDLNKKLQSALILGNAAVQIDTTAVTPSSKWNAFQSIVAYLGTIQLNAFFDCSFLADANDCPLNGLDYTFQDTNTFLPLTSQSSDPSRSNNNVINPVTCQWTVTIPDNHKLKVVLRYSQVYPGETFNVVVDGLSTNLAYNLSSPLRFVFDGERFIFRYDRLRRLASPYGFFAVISIIQSNSTLVPVNSPKYDPVNGYQNDQTFSTTLQVPPNKKNLRLTITNLDLEAGCDDLTISANGTATLLAANSFVRLDDRTPMATLAWSSDGNNRQAGFNYETSVIDCSAPIAVNYVLPCSGQIINQGFSNGYCAGQQQKLQLTIDNACSTYEFDIVVTQRLMLGDIILIYSGEELVQNITGTDNWIVNTIMMTLTGSKPLLVNFQAVVPSNILAISKQDGSWNMSVAAKNVYAPITKILQVNSPIFQFKLSDLRELQKLQVQSPNLIDFMIVGKYDNNLINYNLYEGTDGTTFVANLGSNDTFQRFTAYRPAFYRSNTSTLTVQKSLQTAALFEVTLLFRISDSYIPCNITTIGNGAKSIDPKIPPVFQPADTYTEIMATGTTQACTFNIVTYQNKAQVQFSSLQTTAPTNTAIMVYSGDGENITAPKLTSWSQANVAAFQSDFVLPAEMLTFMVPQGTGINFLYRRAPTYETYQTAQFSYINQTLLFASPYFGDDSVQDGSSYYQNVTIPESKALAEFEIIVNYRTVSNGGEFYILNGNNRNDLSSINLGEAGKITILTNNFQIKLNYAPFVAFIFCLILKVYGSTFPNFKLTKNSLIELDDKDGSSLPLCADSLTESLAREVCHQQNSSFKLVSLTDVLSLNVHCQTPDNCTQYLAFGCSNGVEIHCGHQAAAVKCPKHMHLFGGSKCISISDKVFRNYENARDHCAKQHLTLLSMSADNITTQINGLLKILNHSQTAVLSSESKLLTSGIRKNNQWIWEDNVIYNNSVSKGKGRCLGLFVDELVAVDCNNETFIPICELNLATNCMLENGIYDGNLSKTKSGLDCLTWNNPGPGQHTELFPDQKLWNHNYCRNPGNIRQTPWCLVAANTFQECAIPICSNELEKVQTSFEGCSAEENRCGSSNQCVHKDYFCDYETDCHNGFDEQDCSDYLSEFDFVGAWKLGDQVNEIWTHIAHAQGCAERCVKAQSFRCESFSYDEIKRLCSLSSVLSNPAILVDNDESKYYRRRFSNTTLSYRVEPSTMTIMIEKNSISTALCLDQLNDTAIDVLCEQFGFGQPLKALPSTLKVAYVWTVDCLRNPKCDYPDKKISLKDESFGFCNSLLRCSTCHPNLQFACLSTGYCIPADKVCNNFNDCSDGSDEDGCQNPEWRLIGTNETNSGRVQLFRQNSWFDVCLDDLEEQNIDIICQKMSKGVFSQILPLSSQFTTLTTYKISCSAENCSAKNIAVCQNGILSLRCFPKDEQKCGARLLDSEIPKKKSKRRFARVVNGFNTVPGAYPWTAAVKLRLEKLHHCGASVISANYLLSAAHCFHNKKPEAYTVVVGDWNSSLNEGTEQTFTVLNIHFYPLYEDIFQHDIVLIEINGTMKFNNYVQPICLPPTGYKPQEGELCTVTGWGSNGTTGFDTVSIMQAASLPILNRETCLRASNLYSVMSRTSFCAGYFDGGVDSCQGDSGGPFACEYKNHFYLAGIISWGDSCAQAGQPGIYTMVVPYLSWINNVTGVSF
uniref:Neurotrypsin n=1 Tax=Panagrolaimus sp. JU765 TaxID=591449 RepID=A0AC34QK16_9BILA